MADIVEPLFTSPPSKTGYPFDLWLDGNAWAIKRGEDFSCSDESFERQIRRAASGRNRRVAMRWTMTGVTIQAW